MPFKAVFNACFGGFSLSDKAVRRYAEIKGLTLYPEEGRFSHLYGPTYYTVPPEQRVPNISGEAWGELSLDERKAHNEAYSKQTLNNRDIPRDDPTPIQVVEEMGAKASGAYASLKIAELPDDMVGKWHIDEYDGSEHVAENHRTWN